MSGGEGKGEGRDCYNRLIRLIRVSIRLSGCGLQYASTM